MNDLYKQVRRVAIGVIGFTVLLIGIAMIVTPGPAILVIPLGLAILATEFVWARRLLNKVKGTLKDKALRPVHWFKLRFL
jgi:tellurite resistance protein TerC